MGSFALDLQKFAAAKKADADKAVAAVLVRLAGELDARSPVGDASYWVSPPPKGYVGGHFRGNWQLGIGEKPTGEIKGVDPTGETTLGNVIAKIPGQAAGLVYWLANNVPYARRLEDGWSRQAPEGVVGRTVVQFQAIVDDAVKRLGQ